MITKPLVRDIRLIITAPNKDLMCNTKGRKRFMKKEKGFWKRGAIIVIIILILMLINQNDNEYTSASK